MKTNYILLLCLLSFLAPTHLFADDDDMFQWETSFEDSFVGDADPASLKQCMLTPQDVLTVLTSPGDGILIQNFLEQDFYLRTNPVTVRPLHDLPILHPLRLNLCTSDNRASLTLFFNQMRKAFVSPCSPYIYTYLNITNPDLMTEFQRLAQQFNVNFPVGAVFSLFNFIKLEERRLGGWFTFQDHMDCFEWRIQFPIYYIEHNFYLSQQEQDAIAGSPFFQAIQESFGGPGGVTEVEDFFKQHLVNDMLGFGDLYVQVLFDVITTDTLDAQIGFDLTFPSAIIFKRGLIGRGFPNCPAQPMLDFYQLACLLQTNLPAAQAELLNFGIGALDRLTNTAAHTRLGEEHFGLGFLGETFWTIDYAVALHNELRIRYLFSSVESRFFTNIKNPADFTGPGVNYADPNNTLRNLTFLAQQAVLFLYPPVALARVYPGSIIEFSTALEYEDGCMRLHAGYDIWYQAKEQLSLTCDSLNIFPNMEVARKSAALQNKMFGRALFAFASCNYDWHIGLLLDLTFGTFVDAETTKGIGEDWSAGIDFTVFY